MNIITPDTDGVTLILKMYREIGVEPIIDTTGQISHIQTKSSNGTDVYKLPFELSPESQFTYANRIWDMCS
ncbi:hypothetical protein BDF19DRAFT_15985 [Syncephalis fuscata]|nr:hypothetical protein BDF19DRAFT_15985 [Syncephalis fuscata]